MREGKREREEERGGEKEGGGREREGERGREREGGRGREREGGGEREYSLHSQSLLFNIPVRIIRNVLQYVLKRSPIILVIN